MPHFWVTFTGKAKPGSVTDECLEIAREAAESKIGEAVRTIDMIPYASFPMLHWNGPARDGFEPRCSDPNRCKGHMSCQKQPSCSE